MRWNPVDPLTRQLPDTAAFLETLGRHDDLFERGEPAVVARAPGRLDLMGGIADYSGALVLQLPLAMAAYVAAQRAPEPFVTVRSLQASAIDSAAEARLALDELAPGGEPLAYDQARALLAAEPRAHWAAYLIGALVVLGRERGLAIDRGARILLDSRVPPGKGVSSSAAIEVAAMQAIAALYGLDLPGRELALLCQKVENLVVGAPCGVMDQMTAACGERDTLLALRCQPAELEPALRLPADLEVWGIDSGIRHAVSGADYGSVRVGAFMGYRILAEMGQGSEAGGESATGHPDLPYGGYLANVAPSEWEQRYRARVPETLGGAEFLARYGGTADTVTRVDPARTYAVRQPTAHPIYEHHRVRLFRALLEAGGLGLGARGLASLDSSPKPLGPDVYELAGELMYQSHASYSACGLGSDGTDLLVDLARAAGPDRGLYGAKITGGGSGGTVALLARRGAAVQVRAIAAQYERETGRAAMLLHGSSPGAKAFGVFWAVCER